MDGITYELLNKLPIKYYDCLAKFFNDIWKNQTFPEIWKSTQVIPIPKPNKDRTSTEGYRPISLLPVLLKCFNTVVKNKLEAHVEAIKYIPKNSVGFTKGKGTNDIFYKLNSAILKNKSILRQILLSIDFTKAFDNVNIAKLIKILTKINTEKTIINWLKQFLYNRKIIFDNNNNKIEITTCMGLPQGSVLSPLLFNIYTAELHSANCSNINIMQYADDFGLLISAKQIRSLKNYTKIAVNKFTKIAKN